MNTVLRKASGCINRSSTNYNALAVRRLLSSQPVQVGDEVKATRTFSQDDVKTFASLTGDFNPIHLDMNYAKKSGLFDGTIVHGVLINGFVTSLIGTKLPGHGCIAVTQEMRFPKPLYMNEIVTGHVKVTSVKKRFVFCSIQCTVDDKIVLDGTATVMLPKS